MMLVMARREKAEDWMRALEWTGLRVGRANEMLQLWNAVVDDVRFHRRWSGLGTVLQETTGMELVEWFVMAKIGYGHVTADIDDFLVFMGDELVRCVTDPVVMNQCITTWLDDEVVTGAATVMAICRRRCHNVIPDERIYARFLWYMMKRDTEPIDVGSKWMVSGAFTRFRSYEDGLEEDDLKEWVAFCDCEMASLKEHVMMVM